MIKFTHSVFAHLKGGWQNNKKLILWSAGITTLTVVVLAAGVFAYAKVYEGRIYPNVYIGGVKVAGLTTNEATELLQNKYNDMINQDLTVMIDGRTETVDLSFLDDENPDIFYDYISFTPNNVVKDAYHIGRDKTDLQNIFTALVRPLKAKSIDPNVVIFKEEITDGVKTAFADLAVESEPTVYAIELDDEIEIEVVEGVIGREVDMDTFMMRLEQDVKNLELSIIETTIVDTADVIMTQEAETLFAQVEQALLAAPYTLTYTSQNQLDYDWEITDNDLADWLMPIKADDDLKVSFNLLAMEEFIEEIREDVDIEPKNARFQMEGNKVVEFAGSFDGVELDTEATFNELAQQLGTSEVLLDISVITVEPEITTENVNDLGITEILGTGTSTFYHSSNARITNIQHGSDKINGVLIAPGEVFSLTTALRPYTLADGYVNEMVIIGDEIKPAVGGGLCQVGTTLFRAVMMAGLEVVERRNHAFVVSYYDDERNGNPGVDATIYDPHPDMAFRNNTENYVLLTTELDVPNRKAYYTFWGTSDGREGYYTPPEIINWAGYAGTEYRETTDLAPGAMKCQSPFPGATTSFDYIITWADGSQTVENFTSVYRTLPRICKVGVTKVGAGETDGFGNYIADDEPADDSSEDAIPTEETPAPETPAVTE